MCGEMEILVAFTIILSVRVKTVKRMCMAYHLECEHIAEDAYSVIHPSMCRGHSNLCEPLFIALPYLAKDQNLCR